MKKRFPKNIWCSFQNEKRDSLFTSWGGRVTCQQDDRQMSLDHDLSFTDFLCFIWIFFYKTFDFYNHLSIFRRRFSENKISQSIWALKILQAFFVFSLCIESEIRCPMASLKEIVKCLSLVKAKIFLIQNFGHLI